MAQKFLTDIEVTRGLVDSSGDLGVAGQVLSSTGSGTNWITNEANSTVVYLDEFTGDNSTVDFTLSVSVTDENITQVYIDGVYQNKDTYSVSNTTLTFSTAPPLNADIEVITFSTATTSDDLAAGSVIIPVKNTHTASIAKGEPVYITGNVGSSARLEIAPADASNSAKMPAAGLLLQTLAVNAEGYVITGGYLRNITTDTIDGTSTSSNDTVYVKSGGGLTMTKPTGTNLIQNIAKVARSSGGNSGSLLVSSILRTNDVPNITNDYFWLGNSSGVATATSYTSRFDTAFATKDTDDLSEGATNLYYTDTRVGTYLTNNSYATQSYVNTQVSNLVDSAPSTLDTLNELAAALGDDANFSTTVTNSIATKMPLAGGIFTGNVQLNDNIQLNFGSGADFKIKHNGSNAFLENYTGALYIDQNADDGSIIFRNDDGSGGIASYIQIKGNTEETLFTRKIRLNDNVEAHFGTARDLKIYHNGSNSYIDETGTGSLFIKSTFLKIRNEANESMIDAISDGAVNLYYDNVKKFETTSAGITITGTITASGYNNTNWDAAYTYSQVGHLPLAGGTLTGGLTGTTATFSGAGTFTSDSSTARVLYLEAGSGNGNIIQFQRSSVNKWELVGREGTFYVYKNDGTGSGYKWQIDSNGNHTITGDAAFADRILSNYTGTSYHILKNATSNGTVLRLETTGDSRLLYLQTDHIYSNGALYFGDNSYSTNFRGSSYSFSTGNATFSGKVGAGLSPSTSLHVSGSALTNNVAAYIGGGWVGNDAYHKEGGLLVISGTNATQTGAGIAFQTRNTGNTNYHKGSMIMDRDGALSFELGGQGTGATSEKFKITAAGNATFSGNVVITGSGSANSASLQIDNPDSNSFNHSIEAFAANLTNGESNLILVGKEGSTKNSGYIGYYWTASGSNNNFVSLGHWAADHLFRVYGDSVLSTVTLRSDVDMHAPIFYDKNNTSFYAHLDNSGGNTSINAAGVIRGNWFVASNYTSTGYTIYKGYDNWNHFISVRGHARPGQSKTQAAILGGHQTSFVEYAENNATTGWFFIGSANSTYEEIAKITKDFASFTQVRAPIFYDSNNTNYSLDLNNNNNSAIIAGSVNCQNYNKAGLLLNASGTGSSGAAFGMQQVTSEGWTGIFVDYEPYTGWGLYHDNPNNYFCVTAESSTGNIRSFTVPSRSSGNRTSYEKIRFDQNNGNIISGGSMYSSSFIDQNNSAYYLDPNTTGTSLNVAGKINASNFNGTNFKYLGTGVSYDINNRNLKVTDGIAIYGAYNGGSNSPHTYDMSMQVVGNSRGFELSAAWWSQTALYIRTLRDCCTNWSSWYAIALHGLNPGTSAGALYAAAFYDSGNTAYYVNPESNSNLYSTSLYNISTISRLQSGGNLNGQNNFAFGNSGTLGSATSNSNNNAAIGFNSQASNSTGDNNFSFGYASLYSLSSGSNNIAIGDATGYNVTSGSNNLLFGVNAGRTGYQTPQSIAGVTTGSNQIHMGNESHTTARIQISWTVNSDARDKTDVTPIDVGLDFVNQLNPVTFRWDKRSDYEDRTPTGENKLEELTLGFLAQEVEEVEKSYGYDVATKTNLVVDRDVEQDHFGITYEKMIPILTKAIQELTQEVQTLKDQINGIN